jgi:hypothetical protein
MDSILSYDSFAELGDELSTGSLIQYLENFRYRIKLAHTEQHFDGALIQPFIFQAACTDRRTVKLL